MFVRKIKAQSRPLLHSIFWLFKQSNTFTSNKREDLSTQILLPGFKLTTSWVSLCCRRLLFFKKWANPGLFFIYFRLFQRTLQFLQQINVKNVLLVYDSNSWPLESDSPSITTRPQGSPPCCNDCWHFGQLKVPLYSLLDNVNFSHFKWQWSSKVFETPSV